MSTAEVSTKHVESWTVEAPGLPAGDDLEVDVVRLSDFDELEAHAYALEDQVTELQHMLEASDKALAHAQDTIENEGTARRLIQLWVDQHGEPMPWHMAVEITAIVTKMDPAERDRLLAMDDTAPVPAPEPVPEQRTVRPGVWRLRLYAAYEPWKLTLAFAELGIRPGYMTDYPDGTREYGHCEDVPVELPEWLEVVDGRV